MSLASRLLPVLAVVSCSATDTLPERALDICQYELVFADEFEDLSISAWNLGDNRWTAHTPWAGDFGDARFADPGPVGPFRIEDSSLVITASKDADGTWQSGLIAAADETGVGHGLRYGYFEARLKLPPGSGTWPAFWLMSLQPRSEMKTSIEIDVFEYYGHRDDAFQLAWHVWEHSSGPDMDRGDGKTVSVPAGQLVGQFNTFGVEVTPELLTYYLNRRAVASFPTPEEHNDLALPLYPIVNLALGSGWPIDQTPDPSELRVDYVRIYRPVPAGVPSGLRTGCSGER